MSKNPWKIINGNYYLLQDTKDNRLKLREHLTPIVRKNKTGSGIKIFLGPNKIQHRLGGVDKLLNPDNKTDVVEFRNEEGKKVNKQVRKKRIETQTSEQVEKFNWKTKPKQMHAHHIRMVAMFAPFYKGLSESDQKKLTQYFVDKGFALGDAKSNLALLTDKQHTELHNWMIDNNIQVNPDTTGKGNFILQTKGRDKGKLFVRGGVEGQPPTNVKAVFPTGKIGTTFTQRKNAAGLFLEYIQQPIEEKLKEIQNRPIRKVLNTLKKQIVNKNINSDGFADVDVLRKVGGGLIGLTSLSGLMKPDVFDFLTKEQGINVAQIKNRLEKGEDIKTVLVEQGIDATSDLGKELLTTLPSLIGVGVGASVFPGLLTTAAPVLPPLAVASLTTGAINTYSGYLEERTGEDLSEHIQKFRDKGNLLKERIDMLDGPGLTTQINPKTGEIINPTITQGTRQNPIQRVLQNIENRKNLAQERFNPDQGEFGLSEIIYGR